MHDSDNQQPNEHSTNSLAVMHRKVRANHGSMWLIQAYGMFKESMGAWFGVAAFLAVLLLLPAINTVIAILMPFAIGGLMLGCHRDSDKGPLKFEHLFEGIKSDGKELMILSLIYALASILIMLLSFYVLQYFGIDIESVIPANINSMTESEKLDWINTLDPAIFLPILLGFLISMALMIPVFMAYWFAPALIVLKKLSAIESLKLSYAACRNNLMPFLIYGLVALAYLMGFIFFVSIVLALAFPIGIILMIAGYLAFFAITLASVYTSYIDVFDHSENSSDYNQNSDSDSSMIA